ncbi:uncharacterized protein N7482_003296 [Penicillium canariense]|uniref:Uncharacterized protein n=1 Tax=Penicillium canariense TaxID=189055 RepID=A0A9W9IA25_9EURO|nr:uncharacterized protein N7482_003296 [Penicillium canariense]KAJ5167702.1 hypothetical protein N7482_003296 [Penicillium canariense]
MPMTWDSKADAKLLNGIISTTSTINYEAVADFMGPGSHADCTVSAIKHRISRLREKAGIVASSPKSAGRTKDLTSSPTKKRASTMKATKESASKPKVTVKGKNDDGSPATAVKDENKGNERFQYGAQDSFDDA